VILSLFPLRSSLHAAPPVNLVPNGSFEGGPAAVTAAGWQLHKDVSMEKGAAADGDWYVSIKPVENAGKPNYVRSTGIPVKPNTGYIARCRLRLPKLAAHHTFGITKADGSFLVCRDAYVGKRPEWTESLLPFRTESQTRIGIHLGRRYGKGEIWYDAVELIEDNGVRIGDVSPRANPVPMASGEEKARGCIVSRQPWLRAVYPTFLPTRSQVSDEIPCRLAPGEYEPATFSVTALRPLSRVTVELTDDLVGPDGSVIPKADVTIGVVRTIKRWLTASSPLKPGQRYERRPLFIFPNSPVEIPEHETRRFWLTVRAQRDAVPGRYRGSVTVSAQDSQRFVLALQVEVLPIELPEPEVAYGMYYRQHKQYAEFRTEAFLRRSLADMKAHGMNSFSLYADLSEKKPDGSVELNPDGGTPYHYRDRSCSLNWQMRLLAEHKLLSRQHPLLLLPDWTFTNNPSLMAPFSSYGNGKGWPEFLVYLVDEPYSPKKVELAKRLNDLAHQVPGIRTVTAMGNPGELADYYDVWIVTTSIPETAEIVARARDLGKEVWSYNCVWNGSQPMNDRFFAGYHTWAHGLRGNWQWCYTEEGAGRVTADGELQLGLPTYEDPWRVSYVLSTPDGNVPTLGWEARREGIDDYRYLQALREAVRGALKSGTPEKRRVAREAQAFLSRVREQTTRSVRPPPALQPEYVYSFLYHPDLLPDDYDAIRQRAAEHLVRLQ